MVLVLQKTEASYPPIQKRTRGIALSVVILSLASCLTATAKRVPSSSSSPRRLPTPKARKKQTAASCSEEESLFSEKDYDDILATWSEDFLQWDDNDSEELPLYYSDESEAYEESSASHYHDNANERRSYSEKRWSDSASKNEGLADSTNRALKENLHVGGSKHPTRETGSVVNRVSVGSVSKPNLASTTAAETTVRATPVTANLGATDTDPTRSISGMTPWVRRYLTSRPGLLVIPQDFWLDNFNLAQLPPILEACVQVSPQVRGIKFPPGWLYKQALQRILAQDSNATALSTDTTGVVDDMVEGAACLLYQFVHQRYALAPRGLEALRRRFTIWQYQALKKDSTQPPPYGRCPRTTCCGFALVPSGPDHPSENKKEKNNPRPWRYCGLCQQTWRSMSHVPESTEGCAWGRTFGPLFHLTFPSFLIGTQTSPITGILEPRVFGFRLHPGAVGQISFPNQQIEHCPRHQSI